MQNQRLELADPTGPGRVAGPRLPTASPGAICLDGITPPRLVAAAPSYAAQVRSRLRIGRLWARSAGRDVRTVRQEPRTRSTPREPAEVNPRWRWAGIRRKPAVDGDQWTGSSSRAKPLQGGAPGHDLGELHLLLDGVPIRNVSPGAKVTG